MYKSVKSSLFLPLVLLLVFPSVALANQLPYNSMIQSKQPGSYGYYRTFAPNIWYSYSTRNPITWTNVSMPNSDAEIATAFNQWFTLSGTPSWMAAEKNDSSYVIRFTKNNVCQPNAAACIQYQNEFQDVVRRTSTWGRFTINYPLWDSDTPADRVRTITHELGHVLGLADIDCVPQASTIMMSRGCAYGSSIPTTWDNDNLRDYWMACDGLYSWCGTMHPYNNPSLVWDSFQNKPRSEWENHSWMNYTSVMYYYTAPHWSGPYTLEAQKNEYYNGIGYWEDAVIGSHYISQDWGVFGHNWTSGEWLVVCNKPWIWYGIEGYWTCSSNALQIP